MHQSTVSWEITLLYFFSSNFISFGQKKPHQNAKFHTFNCSSEISPNLSFCWKCIKFLLKNYRGVMSHDTEEWCKNWRKTDLLFQKQQEFGEFWPEHSKCSTLMGSFCANYIAFDIKKYRGVIFRDTERHWLMQNLKKN